MVQAVRADDRLLGAGVAVRVVLARPDALGVLARSARAGRSSEAWITRQLDRFNEWFNRAGGGLQEASSRWALDHRAAMVSWRRRVRRVVRLPARADRLARSSWASSSCRPLARPLLDPVHRRPDVTSAACSRAVAHRRASASSRRRPVRVQHAARDAAGLEPRVHAAQGRGGRAHPRAHRGALHLHDARRPTSSAVDEGSIYVRLVPKDERHARRRADRGEIRGTSWRSIGGATISVFTSDFGGGRKQIQLQLAGTDLAALNAAAEQVRGGGGEDAGRGGHRALDQGPEARARRSTSTAAWPARSG